VPMVFIPTAGFVMMTVPTIRPDESRTRCATMVAPTPLPNASARMS